MAGKLVPQPVVVLLHAIVVSVEALRQQERAQLTSQGMPAQDSPVSLWELLAHCEPSVSAAFLTIF